MIVQRYALIQYLLFLLLALVLFSFVFQIIDIFSHLWGYLTRDVSFPRVLTFSWFYLPKTIVLGFPLGVLFAGALTSSSLFENREIVGMFAGGVSLRSLFGPIFLVTLLLMLVIASLGEIVATPFFARKVSLSNTALGVVGAADNTHIIASHSKQHLYMYVSFYQATKGIAHGIILLELLPNGELSVRRDAALATWNAEKQDWVFSDVTTYVLGDKGMVSSSFSKSYENQRFNFSPNTLTKTPHDLSYLTLRQLRVKDKAQRSSGRPRTLILYEFYHRVALYLAPIVYLLFGLFIPSYFSKNHRAFSLLFSLLFIVVFYSLDQILVGAMTTHQILFSPVIGAFVTLGLFAVFVIILIVRSRS